MESNSYFPESRQSLLKNSFNRGLRCLLTTCSVEKFRESFPSFTAVEQDRLHRLFVEAISSVHQYIQEDFEAIFQAIQAGPHLDTVDELVEEQTLDPLHSEKSNVGEVIQKLSEAKKNEVNHLMGLLEKAEEENTKMKARIEQLKKEKQDFSGAINLTNELRTRITNYATSNHSSMPIS